MKYSRISNVQTFCDVHSTANIKTIQLNYIIYNINIKTIGSKFEWIPLFGEYFCNRRQDSKILNQSRSILLFNNILTCVQLSKPLTCSKCIAETLPSLFPNDDSSSKRVMVDICLKLNLSTIKYENCFNAKKYPYLKYINMLLISQIVFVLYSKTKMRHS